MRKPRTQNERRAIAAIDNQFLTLYGVKMTARRVSLEQLPSSYCDLLAHKQRSWKKHRSTQWSGASGD